MQVGGSGLQGTASPRLTVLYIGGLGRSGSTLLDRIVGQLPGFCSLGEIRDVWRWGALLNGRCGCGAPFSDCSFWRKVGEQAFGGWEGLDTEMIVARYRAVVHHRHVPLLLFPGRSRRFDQHVEALLEPLSKLYNAIAAVSGSRVIIDSSCAPSYACLLRRLPDVDLRLVHLVRDSRGAAYSWNKKARQRDIVDRVASMPRYHPAQTALRWVTYNALVEWLGRLGTPRLFTRYEEFVASPCAQVGRIVEFAGQELPPDALGFIQAGKVALGPNHTVQGNPMRMDCGWIPLQLDEQWRGAMRGFHRRTVTALTWPSLRRYGYR